MSVEKLLAALEKETEMREEAIMKKAEEEAEDILANARKRANQIDSMIDDLKREYAMKQENARVAAEIIRARAAVLGRGWRIVNLAFHLAEERFANFMQSPEYAPFIGAMLAEAMNEVGAVDRVAADPVTVNALRGNGFSVVEDAGVEKGFIAHAREGRTQARFLFAEGMANLWKKHAHLYHDDLIVEASDAG
ncbi:MAG: V-type ATP synthase subunit E family protein [Nitrospinota bacterium]|nr:V-type ATP synthase subunit E family protein [Nitrospinota bacterium]